MTAALGKDGANRHRSGWAIASAPECGHAAAALPAAALAANFPTSSLSRAPACEQRDQYRSDDGSDTDHVRESFPP
jgi:hypothetical protein